MATSMSTCILTALMSAGASWGRAAPCLRCPRRTGRRGGDLSGLREALRDDDAVARLFGDERFEAEQVGGRGHDVLIARIGAHFGLQRPLEQAHFRGKELLVGVEEFRIGKAFHLGREGGDHGVVHRAAYFSQRAQPVEVGLHGLGRVEEGLRVQLAVRRGQRTEGKAAFSRAPVLALTTLVAVLNPAKGILLPLMASRRTGGLVPSCTL